MDPSSSSQPEQDAAPTASFRAPSVEVGLVSVVIPNWNGKRFLSACVDSLARQTYRQVETIVVDNGSSDGSVELLESCYPQVRLIRFERNTGFSFAVNAGVRAANGEYVALLNNDAVAEDNWLTELVKVMTQYPWLGSVACKMLAFHDPTLIDGAGDGYRRGGLAGRIGHGEIDTGQFDAPRLILGPCGGAALYRRSMLDEIGLFDEEYFAYLEDVDIALRAQSRGYKCMYAPTAIVRHIGCGTTGSGFHPLVVRLLARNTWNTVVKNIPGQLLIKFLPHLLYWQLRNLVVVTLNGRLVPWLHGTWQALGLFPSMLSKRREIRTRRTVSLQYLEEIILQSERDLAESRRRVSAQARGRHPRI
jgi:hypothetical protein